MSAGQEQRKAATRERILSAARSLFGEQGYAGTSIEDIATSAGVGIRTIYLHFPSKAAIMLAYFDGWLDAFVDAVRDRPADEPVADTVREVLAAMAAAGWADRAGDDLRHAYPFLEQLTTGPLDIAGHVLQRWMHAMDQLAADTAARLPDTAGTLTPRARAGALFAAWIANMSAVRAHQLGEPLPAGSSGNTSGLDILRLLTGGEL